RVGRDVGLCVLPEFMREGSAVHDFRHPPKVILSASDPTSRARLLPLVPRGDGPLIDTDIELAEMAKYVDNTWHALKIAFANEIGTISKAHGIDGQQVMSNLCADTQLNISDAYLSPGMAFGGSCLPKDVRALTYEGRTLDLELPLLNSILSSNERQIERAFRMVVERGFRNVGILGLSFKPGTDDLRESPIVELAERLLGKGYRLRIYDGNVNLARLIGANRDYILNQIPHISDLLVPSLDDLLDHSQAIIVSHKDAAFRAALEDLREGQTVIDLCHLLDRRSDRGSYDGICW
ncbi:MAG: nucleotide sugar dehydrogenase, partial [Actinomycetota bacterium]|nr:nucleotide sugar dehydrogenase [Actinomycetota bacterium]